MLRYILLLLFLLIVNCNSNSAKQLYITDSKTNKPIEGAWVYLVDKQTFLRSDNDGIVDFPLECRY